MERQRPRQGLGSGNVMVRTVSPACLFSHSWSKGCRRLMLHGAETSQRFGEAEQAPLSSKCIQTHYGWGKGSYVTVL